MTTTFARIALVFNAVLLLVVGVYFFLAPAVILIHDVHHPSLGNGQIPAVATRWHRQLSGDFAEWAVSRTLSGKARDMDVHDISGTEWPMFSAVFFLWATEALQQVHDNNGSNADESPSQYSLEAIEAAAALVADQNNATWVIKHWGANYLHEQNIFYRMLLISGLTSYQNLTGNNQYQAMLEDQVHTLAAELQRSPHGLLDDYPNQCYPIDVLPAIAAISRADNVLGTDHSSFVEGSIRGFNDTRLDPQTQLPAYIALSDSGVGVGPARGVGIAYMLIWSPELWPEVAETWYQRYDEHFWQENLWVHSVREFSIHANFSNWLIDVDAGPVFAGIGTAASAFGIGAARANGRFDQARTLSAEALVAAWPLPDGSLLTPRALSNMSDAPYVGESALLFSFTRMPANGSTPASNDHLPLIVYLGIFVYLLIAFYIFRKVWQRVKALRGFKAVQVNQPLQIQLLLWVCIAGISLCLLLSGKFALGLLVMLLANSLPNIRQA